MQKPRGFWYLCLKVLEAQICAHAMGEQYGASGLTLCWPEVATDVIASHTAEVLLVTQRSKVFFRGLSV